MPWSRAWRGPELQSASEGNETRPHCEEDTVRARAPDELGSGVVHGWKQGGRGQDELDEARRKPDTNDDSMNERGSRES